MDPDEEEVNLFSGVQVTLCYSDFLIRILIALYPRPKK